MKKVILFLLLAGIIILPTMAQTAFEDKYMEEFDKLKTTHDYVYRDGDFIFWQITNYDPDYEYYIRIYSLGHAFILQEHPIKEKSGSIEFSYPGFARIHVNLQKWIPEGKEMEYCLKSGFPCKIGENLDILTITRLEKIAQPDLYTTAVRYWSRNDPIKGASWVASDIKVIP